MNFEMCFDRCWFYCIVTQTMYLMVFEQNIRYQIVLATVQDMDSVWHTHVFVKVTGVEGIVDVNCVPMDVVHWCAEVVVYLVSVSATLVSQGRHAVYTEEIPQETGSVVTSYFFQKSNIFNYYTDCSFVWWSSAKRIFQNK